MEPMAMHVEVCPDIGSATTKLCHRKFEALVVDFKDTAEGLELIQKPREMTSHKGAVVLAIVNRSDEISQAFRAGANFALLKPLLPAMLMRTLRASYPLMVQERRRYFRYAVRIPIHLWSPFRPEFVATSVNVSEGGMALASSLRLRVGEQLNLKLTLPGTESPTTICSEVSWTDNTGRVGLNYVQVPVTVVERLQSWMTDRLEECQPC
jgi:CheY-like chemotaxis protein